MKMTTITETAGTRNNHGSIETNGLVDGAAYHAAVTGDMTLGEVAAAGGRITRVRILTENVPMAGRFMDVSYVTATLPNGDMVNVRVGMNNMIPARQIMGEMIAWAKREGVFAKGIGLLDKGVWSTVY